MPHSRQDLQDYAYRWGAARMSIRIAIAKLETGAPTRDVTAYLADLVRQCDEADRARGWQPNVEPVR